MRTNIPAEEEIIFLEVVPDILFHRSLHLTKIRGRSHLVGTRSRAGGRSSGPIVPKKMTRRLPRDFH